MARVLVIDDDADIRPLLRLTLSKAGHEPSLAARGEEGLRLALAEAFDLIVLDLMMPDVDGYEVTRRLRANTATRDTPILILTARAQTADHEGAIEAGADAYMPKPFEPEAFVQAVTELLGQAVARRAAATARPARADLGQVTVVLGLRGGVGTTTTAITLAGALLRAGRRVCVAELTPNGGHVALHLRMQAPMTWADLTAAADSTVVAQHLARHDSRLVVLAAPSRPVRAGPSAEACQAMLEALQVFFTDVIVDAAPTLDEATWVALGAAQRTLILCAPEVGAIHAALGALHATAGARRAGSDTAVALNHPAPDLALPAAAVEMALGRAPDLVIPYDRQQAAALTAGAPLIFAQPGALLPSAVGAYAARLLEAG